MRLTPWQQHEMMLKHLNSVQANNFWKMKEKMCAFSLQTDCSVHCCTFSLVILQVCNFFLVSFWRPMQRKVLRMRLKARFRSRFGWAGTIQRFRELKSLFKKTCSILDAIIDYGMLVFLICIRNLVGGNTTIKCSFDCTSYWQFMFRKNR